METTNDIGVEEGFDFSLVLHFCFASLLKDKMPNLFSCVFYALSV
jgi:hypothetical protein